MKKIILLLIVSLVALGGCTMYKATMGLAKKEPISTKLPKMRYNFTYNQAGIVGGNVDFINGIVKNDIETNIISQTGSKNMGTVEVECKAFSLKQNIYVGAFLTGITFYSYALLGGPVDWGKTSLTLAFKIYDDNDNLCREFQYSAEDNYSMGLYYGEDVSVNALGLVRRIMKDFKKDLEREYQTISMALYKDEDPRVLPQNQYASSQLPITKASYTSNVTSSLPSSPEIVSDVDRNIPVTNTVSENTFVLAIANEDYTFMDDVAFASNDGKMFKEYCVKTLGVPERQVWLYENASLGIISGGVDKLLQAMNIFDSPKIIVYYCGHGIPDEKTNDAYIIPVDGKATNTATCLSLKSLYNSLSSSKAESVTYFMDACFTGANKEGSMLVAARGVAVKPKEEKLEGNTIVFSASSGDETAMTFESKGHGLFTYFLLKKLQETKGEVSYKELYDYINKNVKKEAFLTNEKPQTPVVATSPSSSTSWQSMTLK